MGLCSSSQYPEEKNPRGMVQRPSLPVYFTSPKEWTRPLPRTYDTQPSLPSTLPKPRELAQPISGIPCTLPKPKELTQPLSRVYETQKPNFTGKIPRSSVANQEATHKSDEEKYCEKIKNLVGIELDYQLQDHERVSNYTALIHFCKISRNYTLALNNSATKMDLHMRLLVKQHKLELEAEIIALLEENTLEVRIPKHPKHLILQGEFQVSFLFNKTSFSRELKGISKFNQLDTFIKEKILGKTTLNKIYITNSRLKQRVNNWVLSLQSNSCQKEAIREAITNKFTLIQGPPGTGKSTTIALMASGMANLFFPGEKILISAPSNTAVDHIAIKLQDKVTVVRLVSFARQNQKSSASHLYLSELCHKYASVSSQSFKNCLKMCDSGQLRPDEKRKFLKLKKEAEQNTLQRVQVVCCTFSASFDQRLENFKFTRVILDEACQATEPCTLLPMMKGAQQVVIIGDHKQLGPVVKNPAAKELEKSLFQRLVELGNKVITLNEQYRMHPKICLFPSLEFYNGKLLSGVSERERYYKIPGVNWPSPGGPIAFIRVNGGALKEGTSFINNQEINVVRKFTRFLLKKGIKGNQIGVISPYSAQNNKIQNSLSQSIEVNSVDGFQGREKDFIVFSCVRSYPLKSIGFVKSRNRLNVALTRSKYGLVLVGNDRYLERDSTWKKLIDHCRESGALLENPSSYFPFLKKK